MNIVPGYSTLPSGIVSPIKKARSQGFSSMGALSVGVGVSPKVALGITRGSSVACGASVGGTGVSTVFLITF